MAAFAAFALAALTAAALADPWKDESGKGHWSEEYRDEYRNHFVRDSKEEFRRGNCKIERKWGRSGEYKEEIKCEPRR